MILCVDESVGDDGDGDAADVWQSLKMRDVVAVVVFLQDIKVPRIVSLHVVWW